MLSITCLVISGIVGFHTLASYNNAKNFSDIYDVIPHGWDFLQGLNVVAKSGIATFSWQLFLLCFTTYNFAIIDGLFDLALAIALIVGVVKQHRFLPWSYAYCNDAADWKNGTDGRNFFLVASPFYNNDEPKDICHAMVYNWIMAIVVITLSLISFLLNISIGWCFCVKDGSLNYCRYFHIFSVPFTYVRNHTEAAGRFSFRYVYKRFAHMKKARRDSGPKKVTGREVNQEDSQLYHHLPYELVVMISCDLHYADLVNVSRSSKRLRRAFFGTGDVAATIEGLGKYVCKGTSIKSQCAFCRSQICFGCRMHVQNQQSNSFRHIKNCRPRCSKCMYKNQFVDRKTATSNRNRRDPRDLEMRGGSDTSLRVACRICAGKSPDDRLAVTDARDKTEIQRLAKQPLTCEKCKKMLPTTGPRWWVDSDTGEECRSSVHPDWVASKDEVQV